MRKPSKEGRREFLKKLIAATPAFQVASSLLSENSKAAERSYFSSLKIDYDTDGNTSAVLDFVFDGKSGFTYEAQSADGGYQINRAGIYTRADTDTEKAVKQIIVPSQDIQKQEEFISLMQALPEHLVKQIATELPSLALQGVLDQAGRTLAYFETDLHPGSVKFDQLKGDSTFVKHYDESQNIKTILTVHETPESRHEGTPQRVIELGDLVRNRIAREEEGLMGLVKKRVLTQKNRLQNLEELNASYARLNNLYS